MTKFTNVSSWLSGIACGVCLVLAVLATPDVARADPPCDPATCCGPNPDPTCVMQCLQTGTCAAAPLCWPIANTNNCMQGFCGVLSSCQQTVMYDMFGGRNCCY